jgi:membrane-bound inhibitor of C-type lysozyme
MGIVNKNTSKKSIIKDGRNIFTSQILSGAGARSLA